MMSLIFTFTVSWNSWRLNQRGSRKAHPYFWAVLMISQTLLAGPTDFCFKWAKLGKLECMVYSTNMSLDYGHELYPGTKQILSCWNSIHIQILMHFQGTRNIFVCLFNIQNMYSWLFTHDNLLNTLETEHIVDKNECD